MFLRWIALCTSDGSGCSDQVQGARDQENFDDAKRTERNGHQGYRFQGVRRRNIFGGSGRSIMSVQIQEISNTFSATSPRTKRAAGTRYEYRGQVVFKTTFGGEEVVAILEKDPNAPIIKYEYKLFATKKTGTMDKELNEAGDAGYSYVGVTVGKTAIGGNELVVITRKKYKSM
ncbi:MAG: hypothetical protein IPK98_15670 [Chloracidobacterium sp.]|nr:hypothetical protein [Chloracidobacterium sp.]